MKKTDLQLIAEFLDKQHQEFAEFLEEEKEIGGCEGDIILEALIEMIEGMDESKAFLQAAYIKHVLPRVINTAEELLTWCLELDKKHIWKKSLAEARRDYEKYFEGEKV